MFFVVWKLFLGDFGIVDIICKTDAPVEKIGDTGYAESLIGRSDGIITELGFKPVIIGKQKVNDCGNYNEVSASYQICVDENGEGNEYLGRRQKTWDMVFAGSPDPFLEKEKYMEWKQQKARR